MCSVALQHYSKLAEPPTGTEEGNLRKGDLVDRSILRLFAKRTPPPPPPLANTDWPTAKYEVVLNLNKPVSFVLIRVVVGEHHVNVRHRRAAAHGIVVHD